MEELGRWTADPFRGSLATGEKRLTKARLRGPTFRPVMRDWYVGAEVEITPALRRRALTCWGGEHAVVAGSLAAEAHGVDVVDLVAELVVGRQRRVGPPGVVLHGDRLRPDEVVVVDGVRVTSPVRTAFDLARRLPFPDAVAQADALGRRHRFTGRALREMADRHPRTRWVSRVRAVAAAMNRLAESLPESRMRIALAARDVPAPVLQHPVSTPRGTFRLDLAWPELKLALEYDGEEHRSITAHGRDLDRDAALDDLGWLVIRVTKAQLDRPDELAARVLRKLAERRDWSQC